MELGTFEGLLVNAKGLKKPKAEKTVFSIGGRGHYENPVTDLLAFFIDPNEEHGFNTLVLESLLEAIGKSDLLPMLGEPPQREVVTQNGNRIDLLLKSDDWILVVENKIRHFVSNPFDDYQNFTDTNENRSKKKVYVLLSIVKEDAPDGYWISLTYANFLAVLKSKIGEALISSGYNKWHVILREFIINLENEIGDSPMHKKRISFVKDNYEEIQNLINIRDEYLNSLNSNGIRALNEVSDGALCRRHNWGPEGIALRFYLEQWGGKTNVAWVLRPDGTFDINIYVYDIANEDVELLNRHLDKDQYDKAWVESRGTIQCFQLTNVQYDNLENKLKDLAKKLNTFYQNQSAH